MKRVLFVGAALIALIAASAALHAFFAPRADEKRSAEVVYVVDGDTIIVDTQARKNMTVRLIGVDTPETVHPDKPVEPYGREASAYTKKRLTGRKVLLEYDEQTHDKYGRELCYVWLDGELFNETLLEEGYGKTLTIPPNDKYAEPFAKAQEIAQTESAGLWALAG